MVSLGCRLVDPMGIRDRLEEKHVSRIFKGHGVCSPSVVIKLIERRDLEASWYLRGDCLTLQCTITVLEELPVATFPPMDVHVTVPPSNLRQNLLELLRRGTGADVLFLVSGESFAAHRNILASRSAVFMAEFFGGMKKCSQVVEVKDMEAAVFKAMLHFIYTDEAPELDQEKGAVTAMAQHLLAAADRYALDRLKLICQVKLSRGISVHTAATTLASAEQHNCSQLKAKCVEFENTTLSPSPEWRWRRIYHPSLADGRLLVVSGRSVPI
ncbi:BTB/POZ and MATH domain-containing protein 1-like [Triticum urartu]|uniref:BTB/POZ and MATH domain-containing protein 1-like n=1 Tax=Triticum urartu TaxID=4572 RepID=UPI0020441659|nr:BTB/POZ and MATH domain-containing protein 1-like [Triticum urartu]